MATVGVKGLTF